MNHYQIHYFGMLADRRGLPAERVTSDAATPAALYEELLAVHPLGMSASSIRVAVNDEFAPWDRALRDGDRIALLPPMSGG